MIQNIAKIPAKPVKLSQAMRAAWPAIIFGLAYFLLARASLYFVIQSEGISAVWPPSGLGLAMLILSRLRGWRYALPAIFLASLCANLAGGNSLLVSLGFSVTLGVEAWLLAVLCERYLPDAWKTSPGLSRPEQVLALFGVTVIGTGCSALLGAAVSYLAFASNFSQAWAIWWISDGLGVILVAPFILTWALPLPRLKHNPAHIAEAGIVLLLQIGLTTFLFFSPPAALMHSVFRVYVLLPLFTWAALRFDDRFNITLFVSVGLISIWGTFLGLGEFAVSGASPSERMLTQQLYLGMVSFFLLILNAFLVERKRVDARLQEGSEQYRLITSTTLDGFWICDQRGTLVDFNEKLCNLLEYPREEMLGLNLASIDTNGLEPWARSARLGPASEPASDLYETVYRGKSGKLIDVELSLTNLAGSGRCLAFVRDISERKRVERIYQARLRLVEYAVEHSLDELLSATLDEAETLTGSQIGFYHFLENDQVTLSLQNWSTRTLREFCTATGKGDHYPIDRAGVWVECVRERRAVIHNDYAALPASKRKGLPEGHAVVVRELVVPVFRGERIVCILGVGNKEQNYTQADIDIITQLADLAWDITERKRTELALRKNEILLRETQSISGVGGWEYDPSARKMVWTDEVYRIYGVSQDHDPNDIDLAVSFYSPQDQQRIAEAFQNAIQNGVQYDLELGFINAQGKYRWVSTCGHPLVENGKVIRVTGNIVDITQTKMAEEALLQAYKTLEMQMEANSELQAQLMDQATHDSLTTLYNRRFMEDALRRELSRAEREGYPVSVLMLDIDRFKPFNDTYGHDAGDRVLVTMGEVLISNIRTSDFACRYGGEEFVVIMPGANVQDARQRADLIRENFSSKRIQLENYQISSTVSVGVAYYPACATRDELLRAADAAMYIAKQTGRNRVCVWSARSPAANQEDVTPEHPIPSL